MVDFRHVLGYEASEQAVASANSHCSYYLDSLRMFCETGTVKPFRPDSPQARVAASDIA